MEKKPLPFGEASNDFAVALYRELAREPGNIHFSPFSIRMALGMALAGARGKTAKQIRTVLHIPPSDDGPATAGADTIARLTRAQQFFEINVANSMWGQKGMPLQPEFVDVLESAYWAVINLVDLRKREAACAAINRWVENHTKRRIRGLIAPGLLDDDTRLALVNAVYFKALWESPFSHRATREANFHLAGGGTVRTSMMYDRKGAGYLKADGFQAVDLAYRGGQLSMLIVLPDRRDGLRYLESDLTASMLHRTAADMDATGVEIYLPKFRLTLAAELTGSLSALGMPLAFDPDRADFSRINGLMPPHRESLWLSAVVHKASVEVNEEGTEAAAATAVRVVERASGGPRVSLPVFRADQPFLFAICDLYSGMILFMGRVMDPTRDC